MYLTEEFTVERQSDSLAIFKSRLKTALFTTAFDSKDVT